MVKVTMKVDNSATAKALTDSAIMKSMEQLAGMVENTAKDIVPVDTGALRGSMKYETSDEGDTIMAVVGTDKEYATYVELGTYKMKAQPYLKPAAIQIESKIPSVFASNFSSLN